MFIFQSKLKSFLFISFTGGLIFSLVLLCSSCSDEQPEYRGKGGHIKYFKGGLNVKINHPVYGSGPNYVVRMYLTREDSVSGMAEYSAKTNAQGIAKFRNIRLGECYVECIVPGAVPFCANEYAYIVSDTTEVYEVDLKPDRCNVLMKPRN